jgi:glyoxylase-like metal-dependent hydrolase (beta-lactamase superfamily II)
LVFIDYKAAKGDFDEMNLPDNIHQIVVTMPDSPLANLNCYLIKGKDGWTMIDTGLFTEPSFDSLKAGLEKLGVAFNDIETILITHIHPDHFGLTGRIKQLSPATKVIMHRWDADRIESRYIHFFDLREKVGAMLKRHGVPSYDASELKSVSMPRLDHVRVTFPDSTVFGGENIDNGLFNLEIIWTPGHSNGHICIYEPQNRVLFSGDHVLSVITPNVPYHVESGDNPLGDYINALHKIKFLPISLVLPGHKRIFKNLRARIEAIVDHHQRRKNEILEILKRDASNAYKISAKLKWNIPGADWDRLPGLHKRIAVMETIAHLESLRWEGLIERAGSDNLITYTLRKPTPKRTSN